MNLEFVRRNGTTAVGALYQRAPLRVLLPAASELGVACGVVVVTSGGLVGGDRLAIDFRSGENARAMVTAQSAEKVYRSPAADCRARVKLTADAGAWLEWLPQETILFDGARLHRRTTVDAAPTARVIAGEILVFGRRARGERLTRGFVQDGWEVRRDGRLVWSDALRLDGDLAAAFAAPACLAGTAAIATLVYLAADAATGLAAARAIGEPQAIDGVQFAATVVGGALIARWLAAEPLPLRLAFGRFWAMFRHRVGGLPETLPRLWWI